MAKSDIIITFCVTNHWPLTVPVFEKIVDTEDELLKLARNRGATHVCFPFISDGLFLKKKTKHFALVARWGQLDNGRLWVNKCGRYAPEFPLDMENRFAELPEPK